MIVLVCGGRDYHDRDRVFKELDAFCDEFDVCVLSGGALGADTQGMEWAARSGRPLMVMTPAWSLYGKAAGPIRNRWMLKFGKPNLVLAFPGGKGTADMVRQAEAAGVPVKKVGW